VGFRAVTYLLVFDDPQYEGLEIRARGASIGQMAQLMDLATLAETKSMTKEEFARLEILFRIFAGCPAACDWPHEDQGGNHYVSKIKSWNLEDEQDGCVVEVPADYAGFMEQDINFQMAVVFAWMDAVVGTPGDLGKDSTDGGASVEESIPMETLSLAPVS